MYTPHWLREQPTRRVFAWGKGNTPRLSKRQSLQLIDPILPIGKRENFTCINLLFVLFITAFDLNKTTAKLHLLFLSAF